MWEGSWEVCLRGGGRLTGAGGIGHRQTRGHSLGVALGRHRPLPSADWWEPTQATDTFRQQPRKPATSGWVSNEPDPDPPPTSETWPCRSHISHHKYMCACVCVFTCMFLFVCQCAHYRSPYFQSTLFKDQTRSWWLIFLFAFFHLLGEREGEGSELCEVQPPHPPIFTPWRFTNVSEDPPPPKKAHLARLASFCWIVSLESVDWILRSTQTPLLSSKTKQGILYAERIHEIPIKVQAIGALVSVRRQPF